MYRHNALSIKETSDKMFVSSEEKQHISDIPNIKEDVTMLKKLCDETEVMYEELQDLYITSTDTRDGVLTDLEILGNTIQDGTDFSNVKFVGKEREDGNYEIELTSCGKNLFDGNIAGNGWLNLTTGEPVASGYNAYYDFIQVGGGETLSISTQEPVVRGILAQYDKDKKFISATEKLFPRTDTLNNNAKYIRLSINFGEGVNANQEISDKTKIQIECGNNISSYELHQHSTSKIILPFQLKKVDKLSDRLFRREDGVWCIEKNIGEGILDENISYTDMNNNETWQKTNTSRYAVIGQFNFLQTTSSSSIVNVISTLATSTTYSNITHNDIEGVATAVTDNHYLNLSILKTKIGSMTIKDYLKLNPIKFWYKQDPQIIELPLDTQIQLNSFFGQTNVYIESGDVDGTIKCKVSKSLGGSINSLNQKTDMISNRLSNIETLQEGNELTISTDKGYVLCKDTRDGYIKDIKIEGNTLVNLSGIQSTSLPFNDRRAETTIDKFKPNTTYTSILRINKNTLFIDESSTKPVAVYNESTTTGLITGHGESITIPKGFTGIKIIKFTTPSDLSKFTKITSFRTYAVTTSGEITINETILEGDHTNNPPEYFEGLLSTGQDKEIVELTSRNELGNLFDHMKATEGLALNPDNTGTTVVNSNAYISDFIQCTTNDTYICNRAVATLWVFYDKNKKFSYQDVAIKTKCKIDGYFKIHCIYTDVPIEKFIVSKNIDCSLVEPHGLNKKQILYKNNKGEYAPVPALRSVASGVKDTIEKHSDGKYYYHKRCEEVVLNGSETWTTFNNVNYTNTLYARLEIPNLYTNLFSNSLMCDNVQNIPYSGTFNDSECVYTWELNKSIYLHLLKTRLNTQDLAGFKAWLANNPTTLVYQLANEEVYECNDIELNSYDNETLVMLDSGVIPPSKLEFKTTSHIGNIISTMKEEVDKNTKFREEMTESVTLTKESNDGSIYLEDTKEGVVSIDKIEGKTLVNLGGAVNKSLGQYQTIIESTRLLKPLTKYTIIVNNLSDYEVSFYRNEYAFSEVHTKRTVGAKSSILFVLETLDNVTTKGIIKSSMTEATTFNLEVILLEGDHSNIYPKYFEGIKSVGSLENELEILYNNSNLIDEFNFVNIVNASIENNKIVLDNTTLGTVRSAIAHKVYLQQGCDYVYNFHNVSNMNLMNTAIIVTPLTDVQASIGGLTVSKKYTHVLPSGYYYLRTTTVNTSNGKVSFNISFNKVNSDTTYKPYNGNKKQILYKNSNGVYEKPILRGIPNGVKDTIEKHNDGKYYYHKRCEEIILNGSESWGPANEGDTVNGLTLYMPTTRVKSGSVCISDRLKNLTLDTHKGNTDFVLIASNTIVVNLLKSNLSSQDAAGFKAWLQSNPTTVVYPLATEEVYECNNLDLSSYDEETSVILNTSIPTKIKASTNSNLLATIDSLKKRVSYLETEFSDMTENGSGWCKLPNGMIMQWGTVTLPLNNESVKSTRFSPLIATSQTLISLSNVNSNTGSRGFTEYVSSASRMSNGEIFVEVKHVNSTPYTLNVVASWLTIGY